METREPDSVAGWELRQTMADYVVAVADQLLADGHPVGRVISEAPRTTEDADALTDPGIDGYALLRFPADVGERYDGGRGLDKLVLGYSAVSGWFLGGEVAGSRLEWWLGAGLSPAVERVAAFFFGGMVDIAAAGSGDRPLYRSPGSDLRGLVERLQAVVGSSYEDEEIRIGHSRLRVCWEDGARDVLDTAGPALALTVRPGELRALERLVDFVVDIEGANAHLRPFARLLLQDWRERAAGTGAGTRARDYAESNLP